MVKLSTCRTVWKRSSSSNLKKTQNCIVRAWTFLVLKKRNDYKKLLATSKMERSHNARTSINTDLNLTSSADISSSMDPTATSQVKVLPLHQKMSRSTGSWVRCQFHSILGHISFEKLGRFINITKRSNFLEFLCQQCPLKLTTALRPEKCFAGQIRWGSLGCNHRHQRPHLGCHEKVKQTELVSNASWDWKLKKEE